MTELTTVKLKSEDLGEKVFNISVAQRILGRQKKPLWILHDNNFELKDGIIKRANSKPSKKAQESGLDNEGDIPPEQA